MGGAASAPRAAGLESTGLTTPRTTGWPGLTATPGTQGQRPWPTARGCFSLTYSDAHGLVMFGGSPTCGLQPVADLRVWSWNGIGWTAITTVPAEVGAREDAILVSQTATAGGHFRQTRG